MDKNKSAAVGTLNRRLAEVATFWHQCLKEYNKIDNFLSSLNALIQSLRNITFVLQKNKSILPDFDNWYEKKQEIMQNDSIMKWLIKARNHVVKKGDLNVNSILFASVKNWLDYRLFVCQYPPCLTNDEIVALVLPALNRERLVLELREPLLQIERSWRVDQFPDNDILEMLSYCFRHLKSIVLDFYIQIGIDKYLSLEDIAKDTLLDTGYVPKYARTINIDLKDGSILNHKVDTMEVSTNNIDKDLKRYGIEDILNEPVVGNINDAFSHLEKYEKIAKKLLGADGFHEPMAHFFFDEKEPTHCSIPSSDKTQQYFLMRRIAEEILIKKVSGIIFILEQWTYPLDIITQKRECLIVVCINNKGEFEARTTQFCKKDNKITFGATDVNKDLKKYNWLRPIVNAWNIDVKY